MDSIQSKFTIELELGLLSSIEDVAIKLHPIWTKLEFAERVDIWCSHQDDEHDCEVNFVECVWCWIEKTLAKFRDATSDFGKEME